MQASGLGEEVKEIPPSSIDGHARGSCAAIR